MDIPYVIIEIETKEELIEKIALLNASSKSWQMIDYVTSWSAIYPDYIKLRHYFQVYDMEMSIVAAILSNKTATGGSMNGIIKKGLFTIINEEEAKKILDYLTDVLKVVPRMNRFENKYVCGEFVNFVKKVKNYNHSRFITNLTKRKEEFRLVTQQPELLEEMFTKLSK
jgi:hypothetical protein